MVSFCLPIHSQTSCDAVKSMAPDAAITYIQRAKENHISESCFRAAFNIFLPLPTEKKIPILLELLSARIPTERNDGDPEFVTRIPGPDLYYPAVEALINLGEVAEPAVLDYIASDPYGDRVGWENAVFVHLMHQTQFFNIVHAITTLKVKRAELKDTAKISRISEAIKYIDDKYCQNSLGAACRAAAESP